jgi:phage-related protein (TIGR01555 family)
MAKAKKGSKPKAGPKVKNDNSTIRNGLGDVLGYTDNANPYSEQISDSGTMFKNLRWYFVSNLRQLLSELYCEIGLIQTIVDVPVDDALRGGVILKSKQLDEDEILKLINSLDRDDDINTVGQAAKWNRLFGGAGVLIMTDQDPMQPLNIEAINKDTPLEFRAVDMWELFWDKQNTDGYDPSLQTENFEHYSYYSQQLHKSRVMRMKGLTAPSFLRPRLRGWGFSVVEKLVRSINQYIKATDLGFEVLDEFKLDVYKIKNLTTTLMSEVGATAVQKRVQMANWQKNYQNAIVMDSEDDFDHKQLSFAGLAEAMEGIRMQVASDMRMPITKLFGTSASKGFATDQNDMEVYNAMVEAEVRNKIKYDLLRVIEIKCQKLFGFIPDDLSIEFKPLRVLSAEQEENVKTQKFNRVLQAKQAGEITTFEFREACNKDALLSISLDNNHDQLNTDDPEIAALVAGEPDPLDSKDVEDPGANREDTRKPRAWEFDKDRKRDNSIGYDVAAYEVDGGDSWISEGRKPFFEDPKNVDKSLWERARERSQEAFGKIKWQFVVYIYRKLGGKVK